jgi:hypothetical protein
MNLYVHSNRILRFSPMTDSPTQQLFKINLKDKKERAYVRSFFMVSI